MARKSLEPEVDVGQILDGLSAGELREVLAWAADWHEDVERRVRLLAARATGDLRALRAEVDRGLRTRRFLGYRESVEWAHAARPVLTELDAAVGSAPSRELVELLERAVSHVVKVIQARADDSSGLIGDLARDLLDLHARACDTGAADPVKLARWMIRFRFVEQDFFEPDPVRYRNALGGQGMAEYRALLDDGDDELAWQTATATSGPDLGDHAWLKLAEARQKTHPADALPIYWRTIDTVLETADRRAYASAIRLLKRARDAAGEAGQAAEFETRVLALREQHRRRPALISMLDKAKLKPA